MKYCTQCGRQLMLDITVSTQENLECICNDCYNKTQQVKQNTEVGGWLLVWIILSILFIIFQSLLSLFRCLFIFNTIASRTTGYSMYYLFHDLVTISMIAAVVFHIIALRKLFKRQSDFLRFTQWFFIIHIASYISNNVSFRFDAFLGSLQIMPIDVIVGVIGMLIWTLYFCKSKRVKAYMGNEDYIYQALFTMGKIKDIK